MFLQKQGEHVYAIEVMASGMERTCHGQVVYKSDQEPAAVAFRRPVGRELGLSVDVVMENSPVGGHRSNGDGCAGCQKDE
jgi:hypothetical protein